MEITRVEATKLYIPPAAKIQDRRPQPQELWGQKVLVGIHTDKGLVGYGTTELVPREFGQHLDDVYVAITRYLAPALIGKDPFDLEPIFRALDAVFEFRQTPEVAVFARCAIDIALHDLMGRATRQPLCKLLGGRLRERVPVATIIYVDRPEVMAAEARRKVEEGYWEIKLKVGLGLEEDLARLRAVREAVGDRVVLRVDANGAWRLHQAVRAIRAFERYDVAVVEQPLPRWDLRGLAQLRRRVDTPIMVDESVHSIHDALAVIREEAADIINLKLVKLGGVRPCRQVALIAEAANLAVFMGSEGETGLAAAAAAHLMAATPNFEFAADTLGRGIYAGDIIQEELAVRSGYVAVPSGPGLGVSLDPEKVARFRV